VKCWFSSLLGHLAVMLGLATVMYASVLMVTRHSLSLTQPYVTRIASALSIMTVRAWWGLLMCMPASPLFRWHPLVSHRLAILLVHLSIISQSPFGPPHSHISWRSFISFSSLVTVFCFPAVGAFTPKVAWLPTFPARWLLVVCWCDGLATARHTVPVLASRSV
jgi:hypothetical protein